MTSQFGIIQEDGVGLIKNVNCHVISRFVLNPHHYYW